MELIVTLNLLKVTARSYSIAGLRRPSLRDLHFCNFVNVNFNFGYFIQRLELHATHFPVFSFLITPFKDMKEYLRQISIDDIDLLKSGIYSKKSHPLISIIVSFPDLFTIHNYPAVVHSKTV